jgi:hypothetical protein
MSRERTSESDGSSSRLEADPIDLKSYVDRRLNARGLASEPGWFAAAFEDSWPFAVADAEAWCA